MSHMSSWKDFCIIISTPMENKRDQLFGLIISEAVSSVDRKW